MNKVEKLKEEKLKEEKQKGYVKVIRFSIETIISDEILYQTAIDDLKTKVNELKYESTIHQNTGHK